MTLSKSPMVNFPSRTSDLFMFTPSGVTLAAIPILRDKMSENDELHIRLVRDVPGVVPPRKDIWTHGKTIHNLRTADKSHASLKTSHDVKPSKQTYQSAKTITSPWGM